VNLYPCFPYFFIEFGEIFFLDLPLKLSNMRSFVKIGAVKATLYLRA